MLIDLGARVAVLGGLACLFLIGRSPWWIAGAVVLIPLGVGLTIWSVRVDRHAVADEALEAAAEYDRTHPDPERRD